MHSLKKLGTGGSAPAQPTTVGAARAFGPGRQPCGGGDCLVLSDSFLSFSANKKSTRREGLPQRSPPGGRSEGIRTRASALRVPRPPRASVVCIYFYVLKKHETGFEPATLALARRYSTTEPLVQQSILMNIVIIYQSRPFCQDFFVILPWKL